MHEAVRQLIHDGLVVQQANCRPVVAQYSSEAIHEVFEMRKILEGESAYRAALLIDRVTLSSLRQVADRLGEANRGKAWIRRWADFDERFHADIAACCGLDRLAQDVGRYRRLHRFFNRVHTTCEVLNQALAEHVAILDALERRDPDKARAAMVNHIQQWQKYFVQQIETEA